MLNVCLLRTAIFEIVQILLKIFYVVTATLPDQTAKLPDHMERYVFRCFLKKDFSYTIINNYHLRLLGQRQGKCRRHRMRKEQGKGFFCWQPPAVHLVQYNVVDHEGNSLHKLDEPKNTEFSGLKRPKPLPSRSYAFAKQNCCQRTSTGLSSMVWVVPCGVPW